MKIHNALLLIIFTFPLYAQVSPSQDYSVETHLKVIGLDRVAPPELWNGKVIFTYAVPSQTLRTRELTVDSLDLEKSTWRWVGHGLKPNQKVRFSSGSGTRFPQVLPLPLDQRKVYYLINLQDTSFQVSLTPQGIPLKFPLAPKENITMQILEDSNPRSVALAFAHEGFLQKHLFSRNSKDIYFYVYEPRSDLGLEGRKTLDYRFILDGLWTVDPTNPHKVRDNRGIFVSAVDFPSNLGNFLDSPLVQGNGEVEFVFRSATGRRISVVGNFNNWDPFMHPLDEDQTQAGIYRIKLKLPPGQVFYSFMVGAEKVNDPLNPRMATYDDGESCSWIENRLQPASPFRGS